MTNTKWNPWNWFKNEESGQSRAGAMQPYQRSSSVASRNLPSMSPMSLFTPLTNFYQDIDRMFEQTFRSFGLPAFANENLLSGGIPGAMFRPNVDIASTDNEYLISVEVPGIDENDIRIELAADNTLIIRGEKRLENREEGRDFQRIERNYGSFQRILSLPEDAEKDNIEAEFNNGVLKIIVSRQASDRTQPRQINISGGGRPQGRQGPRDQRDQMAREREAHPNAPKKAA